LLAAASVTLGGCDRQTGPNAQPGAQASASASAQAEAPGAGIDRSHKGAQMPDLAFTDAKGAAVRLSSLKGRPVLVNLWATWCAPCVAELPALAHLASAQQGKVAFVAISQDLGEPAKVKAFWAAKRLDALPLWLDPENTAAAQWQVGTLPTTLYYDAQGRELWRVTGAHDWANATALLAEAKP